MLIRIIVFALLGAAIAALAAGLCQLYVLTDAGAPYTQVRWDRLAVDVMRLPLYAAFGALTAAVGTMLAANWTHVVGRLFGWILVIGIATALASIGWLILQEQRLPLSSELLPAILHRRVLQFTAVVLAIGMFVIDTVRDARTWKRSDAILPGGLRRRDYVDRS